MNSLGKKDLIQFKILCRSVLSITLMVCTFFSTPSSFYVASLTSGHLSPKSVLPTKDYELVFDSLRHYYLDVFGEREVLVTERDQLEDELVQFLAIKYVSSVEFLGVFWDAHFELLERVREDRKSKMGKSKGPKLMSKSMGIRGIGVGFNSPMLSKRQAIDLLKLLKDQGSVVAFKRKERIESLIETISHESILKKRVALYLRGVFEPFLLSLNTKENIDEFFEVSLRAAKAVDSSSFYPRMEKIMRHLKDNFFQSEDLEKAVRELNFFLIQERADFLLMDPVHHSFHYYDSNLKVMNQRVCIFIEFYEVVGRWDVLIESEEVPGYLVKRKFRGIARSEIGHNVHGQPYVVIFEDNLDVEVERCIERVVSQVKEIPISVKINEKQKKAINQIIMTLLLKEFLFISQDNHATRDKVFIRLLEDIFMHEFEHFRDERLGLTESPSEAEVIAYLSEMGSGNLPFYALYVLFGKILHPGSHVPTNDAAKRIFELFRLEGLSSDEQIEYDQINLEEGEIASLVYLLEVLAGKDSETIKQLAIRSRSQLKGGFVQLQLRKIFYLEKSANPLADSLEGLRDEARGLVGVAL